MNEEMARLILEMTYKEMDNFAREVWSDFEGLKKDPQDHDHFSLAAGFIGSAECAIRKAEEDKSTCDNLPTSPRGEKPPE